MAAVQQHIVNRTPEYDRFIETLRAYHRNRGTSFDPEPKVANTQIDLLQLFEAVVQAGGYDAVSDEKLAWRRMCHGLGIYSGNDAGSAFALKTVFLKNLAAYEITTVHGREPPPKDILEDLTAKGGSLLTRTRANFSTGKNRDGGADSPQPVADDSTVQLGGGGGPNDTPSSARASRGLREAPAQRVIFQPDTGPARQTRHATGMNNHMGNTHGHSHPQMQQQQMANQAGMQIARGAQASAQYNPPGQAMFSQAIYNFEPQSVQPMVLRVVETPSSNPAEFMRRNKIAQMQRAGTMPVPLLHRLAPPRGFVAGMEGPSIYTRCLCALRSRIPAEQAFALSHLVKISYERGDKFRFDSFHGLAEGLVEKMLEVGSLFYDVNWDISYDPDATEEAGDNFLDGLEGTPDILERIEQLTPLQKADCLRPAEFADQLNLITEAALTMRNMVMLPENAMTMADFPPLRDAICVVLHLPEVDSTVELKHFALDIAEQLTPHLALESNDPLYLSLLAQLGSTDRGRILTALRAICRISLNLPGINEIEGLPSDVLQQVADWLLLNDEELLDASLDLLYQFTARPSNIDELVQSLSLDDLVSHLIRLLSHGARRFQREHILTPERRVMATDEVVALPADLQERLLTMEEPERCYTWLKCLFEEDPDSSITQIAIWSAYQQAFSAKLQAAGRNMISPAEFIRNVNHVWTNAGAQILRTQSERGEVQKFIIKGIRARTRPTSPEGRDYFRCLWTMSGGHQYHKCNVFVADAEKMFAHLLKDHLRIKTAPEGAFEGRTGSWQCLWAGCRDFPTPTEMSFSDFMSHIKTHLMAVQQKIDAGVVREPNSSDASITAHGNIKRVNLAKRSFVTPAKTMSLSYEETATTRDERNPNAPSQPAGIPLSAVLVLRNIARNVPKTEAEAELVKEHEKANDGDDGEKDVYRGWNDRLFLEKIPKLYEVMVENRVLSTYITSLLQLINKE